MQKMAKEVLKSESCYKFIDYQTQFKTYTYYSQHLFNILVT